MKVNSKTKMVMLFFCCLLPLLAWSLTREPAKHDKEEILVGAHLPLSGMLAPVGMEQKWAYETAVRDINQAGGIPVEEYGKTLPVRLVVLDDQSDPAKAAISVKRLITEKKVDLILGGHAAASGVIPGCITAEKYRKYYHCTGSFTPPWLEHDFQWATLLFFDIGQAASVPYEIWNSLPEGQRPQRPALFVEDTFAGKIFGDTFREKARAFGYEFVLDIPLPPVAGNYAEQIVLAKNLQVDAILIHASVSDCVALIRNMKAVNFSVKYLHGWKGTWATEFWQALGKDAQYILSDGHWSKEYPYAGARELGDRYYKKFNNYSISVGAFYATAQILWKAIEKAGSLDSAKVRRAVLRYEFDTVLGPITYDKNGVGVYSSPAFQWWNGKLMTVYHRGMTTYRLKLAPPWDERPED